MTILTVIELIALILGISMTIISGLFMYKHNNIYTYATKKYTITTIICYVVVTLGCAYTIYFC